MTTQLKLCVETAVDFRLQLTNSAAGTYGTPKGKTMINNALKLEARFGTSNIHLWGPEATIKRYGGPEEIIRDFLPARLALYETRKMEMQRRLEATVLELSNKHRFCEMVGLFCSRLFNRDLRFYSHN